MVVLGRWWLDLQSVGDWMVIWLLEGQDRGLLCSQRGTNEGGGKAEACDKNSSRSVCLV